MIHLKDGTTIPLGTIDVALFQTNPGAESPMAQLAGDPFGDGGFLHTTPSSTPLPGMRVKLDSFTLPGYNKASMAGVTTLSEIVAIDPGEWSQTVYDGYRADRKACGTITRRWTGEGWEVEASAFDGYTCANQDGRWSWSRA